jgi:hypothetical protein
MKEEAVSMKKTMFTLLITLGFIALMGAQVLADATAAGGFIHTSRVNEGIVSAKYTYPANKSCMVLIQHEGGTRFTYNLRSDVETYFPLQLGKGKYDIYIGEANRLANGKTQFMPLVKDVVTVTTWDEKIMFTISNPQIDYQASATAVPTYVKMNDGKVYDDRVQGMYLEMVKNYDYDYDKAANVQKGYVPVLDTVYAGKKGICYDYSAMLAGALRSQGIPVKLVMGYAPDVAEYHAWNEIMMADGKWVVVDTTADSAYDKGKAQYSFAKDPSKYKISNVY